MLLGKFTCAGRLWWVLGATGLGCVFAFLCLQEGGGIHWEQGPNPLHNLSMEDSCLVGQSLLHGP